MNALPFPVYAFEDLTSPSWKKFLDTNMVCFFGLFSRNISRLNTFPKPGMICTNVLDFDHSSTPHNLQLIRMTTVFHLNSNGANVADLISLEFEGSKVRVCDRKSIIT